MSNLSGHSEMFSSLEWRSHLFLCSATPNFQGHIRLNCRWPEYLEGVRLWFPTVRGLDLRPGSRLLVPPHLLDPPELKTKKVVKPSSLRILKLQRRLIVLRSSNASLLRRLQKPPGFPSPGDANWKVDAFQQASGVSPASARPKHASNAQSLDVRSRLSPDFLGSPTELECWGRERLSTFSQGRQREQRPLQPRGRSVDRVVRDVAGTSAS